jgi:hypothetical protein
MRSFSRTRAVLRSSAGPSPSLLSSPTLILLACVLLSLALALALPVLSRLSAPTLAAEAAAPPAQLPLAPALRAAPSSSSSSSSLAAPASCSTASVLRGALDPRVLPSLAFVKDMHHGRRVRFRHAVPFARCPKYLRPNYPLAPPLPPSDLAARFLPWVQALWVTLAMEAPHLAFAHASPAGEEAEAAAAAAFPGLDAFFGLRAGEAAKDAAAYKEALNWEFGCPPGLERSTGQPCAAPHALEPLASAPTAPTVPGAALLAQWAARTGDLSNDCNVIYRPALGQLAAEAPRLPALRQACAYKFASAGAAAERAALGLHLSSPPLDADPGAVHVCVHLGSSSSSSEESSDVAALLQQRLLPSLLAPQVRVVVHVFGGSPGALAALQAAAAAAAAAAPGTASSPTVHGYAAETPLPEVAWHAARSDFLVAGAGSSLGWPLALFLWRPLSLVAAGRGGAAAAPPLPEDAVQFGAGGELLSPRGAELLAGAAARLVTQAGCGLLTAASWQEPELPLPTANAEVAGYNS